MPTFPIPMPTDLTILLTVMDFVGVFVFGLSGGTLAVRKQLDLFGVMVLSLAAALAGGVVRDLLIGALPPASLQDDRYLLVALAAGLAAFLFHKPINRLGKPVMVLDAAGLGLFTVAGCSKALSYGLTPLPAALLGVMTACGGGAMRDLLVAEVPRVLREEIYAMAALLGAAVVIAGRQLDLPPVPVAVVGALAAFLLRVVSVQRNWSAPKAPWS
ncbi:trimeric intracellular cation channel family protein (plasmid) [Azospirillum ramasamyi]|uniref:Trimeric intracellular cation channel family protein n=1 Tax=Azospirillum ramasamyi TaxID=682998 RepID=A0A2U9SAU3_9PROT|nr:trimeric intracellular cation channel family protein [Azospirillum ramasamyi]AWU95967.1 trimeric intracellular cation channel family protein [Azospirillum ramasamyi]